MSILDQFLAGGTQVRIELPGKGGVVMPVDTIEPPVVLLENGTVTNVTKQNIAQIKNKIKRILFLGDMLVNLGDFLYNNKRLCPSGYTDEWWREELEAAIKGKLNGDLEKAASVTNVPKKRLEEFTLNPFINKPKAYEAFSISEKLSIPLHPDCTFFWQQTTIEELKKLTRWLHGCQIHDTDEGIHEFRGKLTTSIKNTLENLCCPHRVVEDQIILEGDEAYIFKKFHMNSPESYVDTTLSPLEALKKLSGITIRPKAPTTIGARMGRPEKASRREMKPRVHLLFPVGLAGGSKRDLTLAAKKHSINVELVKRFCPKCQNSTFQILCSQCHEDTILIKTCPRCSKRVNQDVCPSCNVPSHSFERQRINIKTMLGEAYQRLGVNPPRIIKGVKGLSNKQKIAEILEKGILRAQEDLSIYKDGTIRFDVTNAPLTHFKPAEIGVPIDTLKRLGYAVDLEKQPLSDESQICELKIQDIVIPRKSAKYFVRVARFVDKLLEKVYKIPMFYKVKTPQDLIGHLVLGLAPHTSVGIVGRVIGFTELSVCYAHPLWHSAKRRDCDGDEDAIILALDTLLNFSKSYLPSQIGGIMDAPLFIIPAVNPTEVQRQAHEFDIASKYPLDFYTRTAKRVSPSEVLDLVELIAHKLGHENQFEGFAYTTPVSDINAGNRESIYKKLKKMTDKLDCQLELAEKIKAVNARTVALKVLTTHFMRDIAGNLRAFTTQGFRCKLCNKRFRRIPLKGKCTKCGGLLSLTVYRGGIEKYLAVARHLVEKYKLPRYYVNRLDLVGKEIITLFEGKKPRQRSLESFA
jgi:DNA polymerase II large subunit